MPCSQMMSMNCSPPRLTEASRPARFPAANARMRNRDRSNIGSATRDSTTQKVISRATPAAKRDHEDRADQQEAHDRPEQVADVALLQRVDPDPGEDRRQADDHDRAVDGC